MKSQNYYTNQLKQALYFKFGNQLNKLANPTLAPKKSIQNFKPKFKY